MTKDDQNTSNNKGDGAPRRDSIWGRFPVVNRRDFMAKSMLARISLPPTWGALSTPATAADAPWDPYAWEIGQERNRRQPRRGAEVVAGPIDQQRGERL
jgi:hypothetical protein